MARNFTRVFTRWRSPLLHSFSPPQRYSQLRQSDAKVLVSVPDIGMDEKPPWEGFMEYLGQIIVLSILSLLATAVTVPLVIS